MIQKQLLFSAMIQQQTTRFYNLCFEHLTEDQMANASRPRSNHELPQKSMLYAKC